MNFFCVFLYFHILEEEEMIIDQTETNLITFRQIICLTIRPSVDVDKRAHELLQMNLHRRLEA